ncbi:hypothetical protein C8R44DRAFT_877480 [Mycena epipterygia]|nr:hypothetical protein C8R44DRAFT_877480 [Mycena epipterygia]
MNIVHSVLVDCLGHTAALVLTFLGVSCLLTTYTLSSFPPHRLATMARTKQQSKAKEMFKPYNAPDVPDIMPFPELVLVATTKGEETAVPRLNEHQQSWILDIGVRDVDLPSLKAKAATQFYDQVKTDAFTAKAFQHTSQPEDAAEEGRLPALVAAWKQKQRSRRNDNAAADDGDSSDEEQDEGGERIEIDASLKTSCSEVLTNQPKSKSL